MEENLLNNEEFLTSNINGEIDLNESMNKIHLRIRKRNGRKSITIVEGLCPDPKDEESCMILQKIKKKCNKKFACNGAIKNDEKLGKIIQFQGDQRENMKNFLIEKNLATEQNIIIHGY